MRICKLLLIPIIASIAITGCSQHPSRMSASDAVDMATKLRYVHDQRTGLCFAVVASRKTADTDQNGFTVTYVPCTDAVLGLIGGTE